MVQKINSYLREKVQTVEQNDLNYISLQITPKTNGSSISDIGRALCLESLHFFGSNGFYGLENILLEQGFILHLSHHQSTSPLAPNSKLILENYLGENGLLNKIENKSTKGKLETKFSF